MAEKLKKSRYWGFIMYPDSRPDDWYEKLQMTGLPIAISPFHDKDCNDDGTLKKPHWHVLLCFDGPTTKNCVHDIADSVHGTEVIPVNSVKGMYRYHVHEDNPEKYPYWSELDKFPRTLINGFDINEYSQMTSKEESIMIQTIFNYINSQFIMEYSDLIDFLMQEDVQAFDYAVHHTLLFNTYCNSKRNKFKKTNNNVGETFDNKK